MNDGEVRGASPLHHTPAFGPAARRVEDEMRALRDARRKARRDLRALSRSPAEQWPDKIFGARSRYRYRAFAELLVEEARRVVKDDPHKAEALAGLVPRVLHWIPGAEGQPWTLALEILARAHRANCLRVGGDLIAASGSFAALRRDLGMLDLDPRDLTAEEMGAVDPDLCRVLGEVDSLEASLCIDQFRLAEAGELLDRAGDLFRRAVAVAGVARVRIKQADLARHAEDYEVAEAHLRRAGDLLDPDGDAVLYLHAAYGRALCLCDLERYDEAEEILDAEGERFDSEAAQWSGLLPLGVRGRIALGRGDLTTAEEAFQEVQRGALELGRPLDAALAALDLAQVYLQQGRHGELRELASALLVTFRARGASRELMAALRLLQRSVALREIDLGRVRQVRRLLRRAGLQVL